MDRLWAPWRMSYITQPEEKRCIFCHNPIETEPEPLVVISRDKALMMMNAFPYNTGHLLIAPRKHTAEISDLSPDERLEVMELTAIGIELLRVSAKPDGFNVGVNMGRVAGAGIADHIHWHIVPRWNGDTNFMPVLADTKVLPESLHASREKLLDAARDLGVL